jgi:hypothetical protein
MSEAQMWQWQGTEAVEDSEQITVTLRKGPQAIKVTFRPSPDWTGERREDFGHVRQMLENAADDMAASALKSRPPAGY